MIGRDSKRRKFINKLREPIIILSNSTADVELINHGKVTRTEKERRKRTDMEKRERKRIHCVLTELPCVLMKEVSLFTLHSY